MSVRTARRFAWGVFGAELLLFGVNLAIVVLSALRSEEGLASQLVSDSGYLVAFVVFFPGLGVLLATRRPDNPLGWLMLGIGFFAVEPFSSYGLYLLESGRESGAWFLAATSWTWVPVIGVAGVYILLLFPDGHLPSPRWRWFAWAVAIGMAFVSLAIMFGPSDFEDSGYPNLQNPLGIDALESITEVFYVGLLMIPLGMIGAAASLVVRFRRSGPTERLQIRWLASAGAVVALLYAATMVASLIFGATWENQPEDPGWILVLQDLAVLAFGLLPLSIAIAVLRYRLYDIDVVIRKAVVYTLLAAFATAVYVGIVVGIGSWVGRDNSFLTMIAAVLVAITFQPVRQRLTHVANRLVYGRRATPYEVLSAFSERVGDAYAADDLLPRMATVLGEGTGATRADVWLKVGDELRPAAAWPPDARRATPVPLSNGELPTLPNSDAAYPVRHQGELLGALALAKPPSDPLRPTDERLASDLAGQAGLVMRNAGLTTELQAKLDELRALQKRLVSAQDEERRRLERNIHDGAQQQLVALTVKARLVRGLAEKDPTKAAELAAQLEAETQDALEDLRDLARGIYPPLLADRGLAAALESQARKSVVPVHLEAGQIGRYPPEVEAAAYFCVLEALQNVAKYARASSAAVRLAGEDGHLVFEVTDDGVGFDPDDAGSGTGVQGMSDRLAALDGFLEVRSAVGAGTVVTGRIPVAEGAAR